MSDRFFTDRRAAYLAAVHGHARGLTQQDHDSLQHIDGYMDILVQAAEAGCQYAIAMRGRPEEADTQESAHDVIERMAPDLSNRDKGRLLGAAVSLAETDPRWWGVLDPATEDWCRDCRDVRPVDEMVDGFCATCQARRE